MLIIIIVLRPDSSEIPRLGVQHSTLARGSVALVPTVSVAIARGLERLEPFESSEQGFDTGGADDNHGNQGFTGGPAQGGFEVADV